ncbi:hypothetical protein ACHAW5_000946 [Stephanodiscus triporus]|uniref:Uncharacterized protein n=1 Tax=Stephanodiscus triporus TaxID=2934178 RepID=A0ABD3NHB9_9STRA
MRRALIRFDTAGLVEARAVDAPAARGCCDVGILANVDERGWSSPGLGRVRGATARRRTCSRGSRRGECAPGIRTPAAEVGSRIQSGHVGDVRGRVFGGHEMTASSHGHEKFTWSLIRDENNMFPVGLQVEEFPDAQIQAQGRRIMDHEQLHVTIEQRVPPGELPLDLSPS